jgi:alpha-beta hydrolase superfamily lysophospholipase
MRSNAAKAILAITLVTVGCSGSRGGTTAPPSGARQTTIATPGGSSLDTVEKGTGPNVVVLSHGATTTKEDMYPAMEAFVADGWRAIAYDAPGVGNSTGVLGVGWEDALRSIVERARATGARHVVLVGSSMGAGLSIAMAAQVDADAVIALSPPASAYDALTAAGSLPMPLFVAAAWGNGSYVDDAKAIAEAAGTQAVLVDGHGHGIGMAKDHPELLDQMVSWADQVIGANPSPSL